MYLNKVSVFLLVALLSLSFVSAIDSLDDLNPDQVFTFTFSSSDFADLDGSPINQDYYIFHQNDIWNLAIVNSGETTFSQNQEEIFSLYSANEDAIDSMSSSSDDWNAIYSELYDDDDSSGDNSDDQNDDSGEDTDTSNQDDDSDITIHWDEYSGDGSFYYTITIGEGDDAQQFNIVTDSYGYTDYAYAILSEFPTDYTTGAYEVDDNTYFSFLTGPDGTLQFVQADRVEGDEWIYTAYTDAGDASQYIVLTQEELDATYNQVTLTDEQRAQIFQHARITSLSFASASDFEAMQTALQDESLGIRWVEYPISSGDVSYARSARSAVSYLDGDGNWVTDYRSASGESLGIKFSYNGNEYIKTRWGGVQELVHARNSNGELRYDDAGNPIYEKQEIEDGDLRNRVGDHFDETVEPSIEEQRAQEVADEYEQSRERAEQLNDVQNFFDVLEGAVDYAEGFGGYSSLFFSREQRNAWIEQRDEIFSSLYLGTQYWASAICRSNLDVPNKQVAFYENLQTGNTRISAYVLGEKLVALDIPEGTEWLYKFEFYAANPRDSYTDDSNSDDFPDVCVDVYLMPGRVSLYDGVWCLAPGETLSRSGNSAFVQYSSNDYTQICVELQGAPSFVSGDNPLCNTIVENPTGSTELPNPEETGGGTIGDGPQGGGNDPNTNTI